MLEVVIPGMRHGEAIIDTSVAYCGCMCYISGITSGAYGTVQKLNVPATTANAYKSVFPVNKYYFEEFYNDTSDTVDKLTKGDMIVYYEGGEYITDKFNARSFGFSTTYWKAVEYVSTATYGKIAYVPGSATAGATQGLVKCFVSTGPGNGWGYIVGLNEATAVVPHGLGSATQFDTSNGYIGYMINVFYTDSSDAKLRFKVAPGGRAGYMWTPKTI